MITRRGSAPRLAFLVLVSAPGCSNDLPERGEPIDHEDDELEDADVCIEDCYPIKQDCDPGESCLPANPGFSCRDLPDALLGQLHDTCEVGSQTCEAGLVCLQAATPGCDGSTGCCVAICDMLDPECTEGTSCYPIFEAAQMCYPNVGVCVLL